MKITLAITIIILLCFSSFVIPLPHIVNAAESGLVGYWKFDEGSGASTTDSSGNGNTGTIHGAVWVNGVSGKALQFNGANSYVSIPHSSSLDISGNQISVEYWMELASPWYAGASSVDQIFYDKGDAYTSAMIAGSGTLRFNIPYVQPYPETNKNSWNAGVWYHIAEVFDGSQIRIYINGNLDKTAAVVGSVSRSTINLAIGSHCYGDSNFFNGMIDEFKIYNYARSAQQISDDYTAVNPSPTPTPTITPTPTPTSTTTPTPGSSVNIKIYGPRYTNNLLDAYNIDNWFRVAYHTQMIVDTNIWVEVTPADQVRNVQVRIGGLSEPSVFTLTKESGNKYSYHFMELDPNNLKNFLLDYLLSYLPVEVAVPDLPDFTIVQPKITSVIVTDINGEIHEENCDIDLPTLQNMLPNTFSSNGIIYMCPVDVLITDSHNRKMGAQYENGILKETFDEIPGVYHFGEFGVDTPKIVILPNSTDTYNITFFAFGTGSFEMAAFSFKDQKMLSYEPSSSEEVKAGDILKCALGSTDGGATLSLTALVKTNNGFPTQVVFAIVVVSIIALIIGAVVIAKRKSPSKTTGQRRLPSPRFI